MQARSLQVLLLRIEPGACIGLTRNAGPLVRRRSRLPLARLAKPRLVRLAQIVLPLARLLPSTLQARGPLIAPLDDHLPANAACRERPLYKAAVTGRL